MTKAVSNTSPLLYLYRIGKIELLPRLFEEVLTVPAVVEELKRGKEKGYDVPLAEGYEWLQVVSPRQVPSEWLASDLGKGELETMALALEHREKVVILDDALARRIAKAAGLEVWGTLRVLLEAKKREMIPKMSVVVEELRESGMWISEDVRQRIMRLAGE
ncbi:DUF3368 domain-containing protein [Candidatus Parcubacteria bacterium]|nr:MAG: DUF3368 domain-containing protein [Candidatus Parcubacteria bacterium]